MNKLRLLFFFITLVLAVVIFKLFIIQIAASDQFGKNNYLQTRKIIPDRGSIFDSHGVPLVFNQTVYRLYVEPGKITDPDKVIDKLDDVLHLGEATLEAKIKSDKVWVSVATGVEKEKKDEVAKLNLEGVGFEEEAKRFYPEASLSAHLVGFVGKTQEGDNLGYFGLEGFYDKDLAGLPGIIKTERDLFGNPIFIGIQNKVEGENGRDLVLTIDKTVQFIAKEKLVAGMKRFEAKEGCIIVANPATMSLIALTCVPDFDPRKYGEYSEDVFKNPAVSALNEPGSIMKPLIVAAALNERVIKPTDTYNEQGPVKVGGYEVSTWDDKYEGEITITRILEKSSNVGMVHIGEKLGKEKLLEYLARFGLGEKTDIDLQGETAGFLKPKSQWYDIDYATATFGQGIVVTPIQMIRAFASIINGGELLKPHVVGEIKSQTREGVQIKPKVVRRVINERTSLLIRNMLQKTVENAEARWDRPKGYKIGGKTGTAQVPVAGHYDPSKTIASFIGFAPVDNPKLLMLVIFKEPKSSPWGSETAAPVFFEVLRELLIYYNMTPE